MQNMKHLYGCKIGATDGEIGHLKDFYFDDKNWAVRYVIADTGSWLTGRQVLISPHAFGRLSEDGKPLLVNLTRKQIEDSPSIELHKPVSRQYEEEYYRYYGWPYYWQGSGLWGMTGFPILHQPAIQPAGEPSTAGGMQTDRPDVHLRSAQAVTGYHIKDGAELIGQLCDFVMDDESWSIRSLVIKTGHWLSGREVQIPTSEVERISFEESTVFVDLNRDTVVQSSVQPLAPVIARI